MLRLNKQAICTTVVDTNRNIECVNAEKILNQKNDIFSLLPDTKKKTICYHLLNIE